MTLCLMIMIQISFGLLDELPDEWILMGLGGKTFAD